MSDQPSSPSTSPPVRPMQSLSAAEAARRELEAMMRSSPPIEDDENQAGASHPGSDQDDLDDFEAPTGGRVASPSPLRQVASGISLHNELAHARRRSAHYKLNPYQREATLEFVKMPSLAREVELFVAMCALDTKIEKIVVATPPFSVTAPLLENIKSYSMAVLLSSKVSAYKGNIPRDAVIAIIKQRNLHLPNNFLVDHHAQKVLKGVANYELTQACADIKRQVGPSIQGKINIFQLATEIVKDTQCAVTVPLCARIALLRKVHVEYSSGNAYWNNVDDHLELVCEAADCDPKKIDRVLRNYLKTDRKTYGVDNGYIINEGDTDDLLVSVDNIIVGCSRAGPVAA